MLGELEDLIVARLRELVPKVHRLTVDSYGGELGDPDLLDGLLKRCPAVLLMVPKAVFRKRSQSRYGVPITFRLVIVTRHPRGERETRRGTTDTDIGSYALWEACMHQLVDWQPWPDRARIEPTELSNLVNGKFQSDYMSVLGQSFSIELDWTKPEQDLPDLEGIDMVYIQPGESKPVVSDHINLEGL